MTTAGVWATTACFGGVVLVYADKTTIGLLLLAASAAAALMEFVLFARREAMGAVMVLPSDVEHRSRLMTAWFAVVSSAEDLNDGTVSVDGQALDDVVEAMKMWMAAVHPERKELN